VKTPNATDVGDRVRLRREMLGLSQNELARELLVHPQTISRWETGERLPGTEDLVKLCSVFSVSIEALLWGGIETVPLPNALVAFFRTDEGKRLTDAQREGLARLLDGYEIDEATLKSALFLLHRQPLTKAS
jgi:transcriptional regulator with XRE-family HTH domain